MSATGRSTPWPIQPTVLSDSQLLAPRITPAPSYYGPNEVVIEIATTLLVPDYTRYYDTPITEFEPSYVALPDGSLTSPAFMQDLVRSNLSLLVTAMLATLFLRNIIVCIDYLRRAKMKRKTLFYILLCSQLLSLGLAPLLISYFNASLNCTAVITMAAATTGISLALLMSGILGLKAYRCLDNSRVVLLVLVVFFCASSALLVLHLAHVSGLRRLTGSCSTVFNPELLRIYVLIQLVHSLFLCSCFLYAVWKSRASPAIRGRLSVRVTLDDSAYANLDKPSRRIWDNILGRRSSLTNIPALDVSSGTPRQDITPDIPPSVSYPEQGNSVRLRRASPSVAFSISRHSVQESILEQPLMEQQGAPRPRPRPTSLLRLIPRMELFHEVMKDELCYTTTITVTIVGLALFLVFGVNFENSLDILGWISTNGAIISLLVIHSFGRVVRRHEKDALFQHPSAWWPDREGNHRSPYVRRFNGSHLRVGIPEDPFSDMRAIRDSTASSWHSEFSMSPSSPSPAVSRDRRLSLPSPYPDQRSSLVDSVPPEKAEPPRGRLPGSSMDEKGISHVSFSAT